MCRDNMTRCITFVLYALLQWCSAEITNSSPESWYNANVINDATYTPKPIMDLISTDQTFTTQYPTYSSINPEFSSVNPDFYSQDPTLSSQVPTLYSQDPTFSSLDPNFSSQNPNFSSQNPNFSSQDPNFSSPYPTTPNSNFPTTTTQSSTFQPGNPTFSTANPIVVLPASTQSSQPFSTTTQSSQPFSTTTQSTTSQGSSTFDPISTVNPSSTTGQIPQNLPGGNQGQNYFVFFQNGRGQSSSTTASTDTVNITPQNTRVPSTSTAAPANTARIPSIRFRIVAPSGSITNVNLNPQTTTRRPTTTRRNRRRNRNRNTYDDCIDACGERRSPICASPLSSRPIDSDNLKGFPSICHMACHNSFRIQPYEKVIDGRCGRLRTRIRPLDANKLRREELNRAQYTVVQNPAAIIEFAPLPSK